MATATARHIPVDIEEQCLELRQKIENGADFTVTAVKQSNCPSARSGWNPEHNHRGRLIPEFDRAFFQDMVSVVHGPLRIRFGYHLPKVRSRQD